MLLTEIPVQEVSSESTTYTREDGLRKSLLMMSTCSITSTERKRDSKRTNKEESFDSHNSL